MRSNARLTFHIYSNYIQSLIDIGPNFIKPNITYKTQQVTQSRRID